MALTSKYRSIRSARTAAAKRRTTHHGRIAAAANQGFRARVWAVVAWLQAEAMATPVEAREELLAGLVDRAEAINAQRWNGGRHDGE